MGNEFSYANIGKDLKLIYKPNKNNWRELKKKHLKHHHDLPEVEISGCKLKSENGHFIYNCEQNILIAQFAEIVIVSSATRIWIT